MPWCVSPRRRRSVDVARSHHAQLRGSHSRKPLNAYHVGGHFGQAGQGGLDGFVVDRQNWAALTRCRSTNSESFDGLQSLESFGRYKLFPDCPFENPFDPGDEVIDVPPAETVIDHLFPDRFERQWTKFRGKSPRISIAEVAYCLP